MEISRKDIDFLKQLSIANSLVQVNQIPLKMQRGQQQNIAVFITFLNLWQIRSGVR